MAFFQSLTFTGTRVAGQRERQTQAFEAGCPYFPRDYPCTLAYEDLVADREFEERSLWERKPPAKRPSYKKLGTRSPWKPDWEVVLGITPEKASDNAVSSEYIPTQRVDVSSADKQRCRPWLLRGVEVNVVLDATFSKPNYGAGLLDSINHLRAKRNQPPLDASVRPENLLNGALVTVKVKMCGKGNPDDLALIYRLDDEEHRKWQQSMKRGPTEPDSEVQQYVMASPLI